MKKTSIFLGCVAAIMILANWGTREKSEISGDRLHRINFYGKIVTVANQDKEIDINNISIYGLTKQIPAYEAPTSMTATIDPTTHIITAKPDTEIPEARIDLSEIRIIKTKREGDSPIIWKYKVGEKIKKEYIEFVAYSFSIKKEIKDLIFDREKAIKDKFWAKADTIMNKLRKMKIDNYTVFAEKTIFIETPGSFEKLVDEREKALRNKKKREAKSIMQKLHKMGIENYSIKNYMVDKRNKLKYNVKDAAGPIETKVDFRGIIKLTINGIKYRDKKPSITKTSR